MWILWWFHSPFCLNGNKKYQSVFVKHGICPRRQQSPKKAIFSAKVKVKVTRSLTLVSFKRVSLVQSLYWKLLHFYPILSYILHPASYILHPASYILHPASYIQHPTSNIQHPTSYIQHPTSYIQHPTSSILHPASYIKILSNPILSYPIQSYPAKIFKIILIETKKLRLIGFKGVHFVIYEVKRNYEWNILLMNKYTRMSECKRFM